MRLACYVFFVLVCVRLIFGDDQPKSVLQAGLSSPAARLDFSPDTRLLAAMGTACSILFSEWRIGRELRSIDLNVHGADAAGSASIFTLDRRKVIVAAPNRVWRIDAATERQLQSTELPALPIPSVPTRQLVLSADGSGLALMGRGANGWISMTIATRICQTYFEMA